MKSLFRRNARKRCVWDCRIDFSWRTTIYILVICASRALLPCSYRILLYSLLFYTFLLFYCVQLRSEAPFFHKIDRLTRLNSLLNLVERSEAP